MAENKGEKLKKRRLELGYTLEDVGKAVGVAKSTVLKWETGDILNIRVDKLDGLAEVLQIPVIEILAERWISKLDFRDETEIGEIKEYFLKNFSIDITVSYGDAIFSKDEEELFRSKAEIVRLGWEHYKGEVTLEKLKEFDSYFIIPQGMRRISLRSYVNFVYEAILKNDNNLKAKKNILDALTEMIYKQKYSEGGEEKNTL